MKNFLLHRFTAWFRWVWPFLTGCGRVWVGMIFIWLGVGGLGWVWPFLTGCGWVWVSVTFFWPVVGRCRWIWMSVGECTVYSYTFWKAFSQTYREEVLPQIYYLFKPFKYPKFCYDEKILLCSMFCQSFYYCFFSLKHDIFVIKKLFYNTHQVRCYHFFIVEIIVESVNLIQMSK